MAESASRSRKNFSKQKHGKQSYKRSKFDLYKAYKAANEHDLDSLRAVVAGCNSKRALNELLCYSCDSGDLPICRYLVEVKKLNVNHVNSFGFTPVMEAIRSSRYPVLHYLLAEAKCNVNVVNRYSEGALYYACGIDNVPQLRLLLEYGADVYFKNKYGVTPVYNAVVRNCPRVLNELLVRGVVDVSECHNDSETLLHKAASLNLLSICKMLVLYDANVGYVNINNQTAIGVARSNHHNELAEWLESSSELSKLMIAFELMDCRSVIHLIRNSDHYLMIDDILSVKFACERKLAAYSKRTSYNQFEFDIHVYILQVLTSSLAAWIPYDATMQKLYSACWKLHATSLLSVHAHLVHNCDRSIPVEVFYHILSFTSRLWWEKMK